jgi:RNA polymerase sigma-70 factor (ECF subfamily)
MLHRLLFSVTFPTVAPPQRSIPGVSDEELIERARSGDRAAFGELVERHQQAVFRTALVALRSRDEAEEVAQDALILAFQKLDRFRGDSSFKTWLLTIAWNRALDRRRTVGEWFKRFVSRDEEGAPEPVSEQASHEQVLIRAEERRQVRVLLRALPARYREPLMLAATGDHTFEEIARLLKIPVGTAKWRAMEGRRLLKRKLQGRGTEVGQRPEARGTTEVVE